MSENKMYKLWEALGLYEGDNLVFLEDTEGIGAHEYNPYCIKRGNLVDAAGMESNYYVGMVAEGVLKYKKINPLLHKYDLKDGDICRLYVKDTGREYKGNPVRVVGGKLINNENVEISKEWIRRMEVNNARVEKMWVPEEGEGYYYVDMRGQIYPAVKFRASSMFSLLFCAMGNCFKTREEAEANKDVILKKYDIIRRNLGIKKAPEENGCNR